ncbi:hypothetical protein [Thalassotalea crassostreae]|uniref:hypothetical protein n=1 Tax=Thalassotalea crassostreae TaxID=1763536 RepID=UPI0008387941|nr:hypothetical protein [Thalassotalea crassostreae]
MKVFFCLVLSVMLFACSSDVAQPTHQRADLRNLRDKVVINIEQNNPDLWHKINRSKGYAVFSNGATQTITPPNGLGVGVIHNNVNGENHYLIMESDLLNSNSQIVVLFAKKKQLERFVEYAKIIQYKTDIEKHPIYDFSQIDVESYYLIDDQYIEQVDLESAKFWQSKQLSSFD